MLISRRLLILCSLLMAVAPQSAEYSGFGDLRYRAIGPAISGGRITAVAGTNQNPLLYYAGGADGGVFKSVDGGVSWNPVFDIAPVASVGAIAIDPSNSNTIWVGTGEANPRNTVESGDGIWRSSDGGATWRHLGLDRSFAISGIAIDPHESQRVIVGVMGSPFTPSVDRGAFITEDGGAHWQKTLYVDANDNVSDIAMDPSNPRKLFAGVWEFHRTPWSASAGGVHGGIFASNDEGRTWRKLAGSGLPSGLTGRIGLSISASDPRRIYAVIQSPNGAVWRSDDGGKSWISFAKSQWVGYRGYYFSKIFADPHDSRHVIDLETLMAQSTDAGAKFSLVTSTDQYDHHALWWSRDGKRIINGADTGVSISLDDAKTWFSPRNLPVSQVYHVGLSNGYPYTVCVGLQDVNSWCGPGVASNATGILNRDWTLIAPGDGNVSIFDPEDRELVWSSETERSAGQIYLTDLRTLQSAEVSPSQRFSEGMPAGDLPYRFDWMTPIAFTYTKPVRTIVGGNVVFATTDRGAHWTAISPDLTRDVKAHQGVSGGPISSDNTGAEFTDAITSLITTPLDSGVIWAGTDDGLVQLSRDGGAHWTNVSPAGMQPWGRVMLEGGHATSGTLYAAFDRHLSGDPAPYLVKTSDFGAHWTSIASDLPRDVFLRCVREDPAAVNLLFACTQRGVQVSLDGGRHWQSLRLNMPASAIYDIEIQPQAHDLVVGTQGRGVWILDDLSPLESLARGEAPTFFPPRDAYRYFLPSPYTSAAAGNFIGENAPYGALLNLDLTRPIALATLRLSDQSGAVVRTMALHGLHAGINRITWDLRTDGPTAWKGASQNNSAPAEGPEVVPGSYEAHFSASGLDASQKFTVRAVSDDPALFAQYQARYAFLRGLHDDLSVIDARLNAIDACLSASCPQRAQMTVERQKLTAGYKSGLEMVMMRPQLRERVMALIGRVGSSEQAPTQAQLDEAALLHKQLEEAVANAPQ